LDEQNLQGGYDRGIIEVIRGLRAEPTYLFVFGLVFLVFVASVGLVAKDWWLSAMVAGLGLLLAVPAMWFVERRKQSLVQTKDPEQAENLERLRDDDTAAGDVFQAIASNQTDTLFVYSSMVANEFFHEYHQNRKLRYPLPHEDSRVTALPDASGIAKVHALLTVAGKDDKSLQICTAGEFMRTQDGWNNNLILIGSHNANAVSKLALGPKFNSPYCFNDDVTAIENRSKTQRWPRQDEDFKRYDYGLIVKLKIKRDAEPDRVYLILAGIGAIGTRAACYYLHAHIKDLRKKFGTKPFGMVLEVDREIGKSSITVLQETDLPEFRYTRG
jgi:hypothetical protein